MNTRMTRYLSIVTVGLALAVATVGCRRSERRHYRSYEGPQEHRPQANEQPKAGATEWEMVSPGEMVVEP